MKRRILSALCALVILVCVISIPALAEETETFVFDLAGILSQEEAAKLDEAAKAVSRRYGCGVYITVFDDMEEYGFRNIESFAEEVYAQWDLGIGEDRNCIILVMSMKERDYDLCAHGDLGHTAFTDYGKEKLAEKFLDDFRNNNWASGYEDFISQADYMLRRAEDGNPVDIHRPGLGERLGKAAPIGVIAGIIIAFIYCGALKSKMKSAKIAREASAYIAPRGVWMQDESDMFTHTTVTRQHIERDSGSRGGHGGTSINSGGFSHSSGKF